MSKNNLVHSIRFDETTYNLIKAAASQEGMSFAKFLKSATVTYIQHSSAYQEILNSINPDDLDSAEKTFSDGITEIKEAMGKTIMVMNESLEKRLNLLEAIMRRGIYAQMYFAPELTAEQMVNAPELAKTRTTTLLEKIDE